MSNGFNNAEVKLLDKAPPGSQVPPGSHARGGILGSVLNVFSPLNHAPKRKERLIEGAKTGNLEMVKDALDDGADINKSRNNDDKTPLYAASEKGHLEVVRELLARGAAVDAAIYGGWTPLLVAILKGHLEIVRELLARGASVDAAMNGGATPLYVASQMGHLEVVRELLERGAAVDAAYDGDYTPLLIASAYGHFEIVSELLAAGAKVSKKILTVAINPEIKALLKEGPPRWASPRSTNPPPAIGGRRRRRYTHTKRTKRKTNTRKK
jgi:ankyrin repeat protein